MDTNEQNDPAVEPVHEAPATASTPSPGSEAPAAALVATDGAAAMVPVEPVMVAEVVHAVPEPVRQSEREMLLGMLHHVVDSVEDMGAEIETHARAAVVAGEADVHAALAKLSMLFGEFRNGLMSAGKTMPAKLESEAAGLVAKAKA